jgi:hypothetical protein
VVPLSAGSSISVATTPSPLSLFFSFSVSYTFFVLSYVLRDLTFFMLIQVPKASRLLLPTSFAAACTYVSVFLPTLTITVKNVKALYFL